jgi:ABC-type multidrug transport system fused ATPase/permease subunit
MLDYTQLEIEDALRKEADVELESKHWPSKGEIEFLKVTMTYREELPPAIKNLSFKV